MKILVNMDRADAEWIKKQAVMRGLTASQMLAAVVSSARERTVDVEHIRQRVLEGWRDGEIAAELRVTNGTVAKHRRALGLVPNGRGRTTVQPGETTTEWE